MNPTVLIVDDEDDLREAIAFDFRRRKFNVLMAPNGKDARKILEKERVDVVVSDVRMPDGDGMDLLAWIKGRNAVTPLVVLITGFADITVEEAYDKGADAVFSKPFDRASLYEAVQRAVQPDDPKVKRKMSRIDTALPIELKFLGSGFSLHTKAGNMGRGGVFVAMTGKFPRTDEKVEFRIEADADPKFTVSGEGIVRWVRLEAQENFPPGCGIEFTSFAPECRAEVAGLVNFLKTKSFIPKK
ncbi:MAG TPA: response regulator [Bdellovibrionota bacterium]|jgi:CheY-like chemotaxis protein